jgi:hypothetical protein
MAGEIHPAPPHLLPFFVPGPDGSDQMLLMTAIRMPFGVVILGVIFCAIHSLPERMAHCTRRVQMEPVAVLCLLALLLVLIDVPTLARPVERSARSPERMAGRVQDDEAVLPVTGAAAGEPPARSGDGVTGQSRQEV